MQASLQTSGSVIRVGLVGTGRQGLALLDALFNPADPVPGVHVEALCDIWPVALGTGLRRASAAGCRARGYDRMDRLLSEETGLDALLVATPDFSHAPIVLAALARGLHVYCESRLAGTLGEATAMVRAARSAGRLLQVGYHRRSDPVYRAAVEKLIAPGVLGPPAGFRAENFFVERDGLAPLPAERLLPQSTLQNHGYANMDELRRWRGKRRLGGGPLPHPGEHQIDTLDWMIGGTLRRVCGSGDRAPAGASEWCNNLALLFEYEVAGQTVRASYQAATNAAAGEFGVHERFDGRLGSFRISPDSNVVRARPTPNARSDHWAGPPFDLCRYIDLRGVFPVSRADPPAGMVNVCPTCVALESYEMIVPGGRKRPFQPHLENFFAAIRGQAALNCPAETAYRTECLLDAIDAVLCGRAGPTALPRHAPVVPGAVPAAPQFPDRPGWMA